MSESKPSLGHEPGVSIVIPAFNEEAAIGEVVAELRQLYPAHEVIVVDDGSTDRTAELASKSGARVLRHEYNMGYGAALKTGARSAAGETIVFLDADGQHDPRDVARLLEHAQEYDMVAGARTAASHRPLSRRPGKWVLETFANFLAGTRIPDLNCGLRAFKKDVLLRYLHLMPLGFSFSTTATLAMLKAGRRIKYVPVEVRERIGRSTVRQVRHGFQTLMLVLRLIVLFEPLKVFLPMSLLLVAAGIAFGIHDILYSGSGIADATLLLSISGILMFFFGLVTDQVSALRREKHE